MRMFRYNTVSPTSLLELRQYAASVMWKNFFVYICCMNMAWFTPVVPFPVWNMLGQYLYFLPILGPTLSTSTSSFEALDPHDPNLSRLATTMFQKTADYLFGELTATQVWIIIYWMSGCRTESSAPRIPKSAIGYGPELVPSTAIRITYYLRYMLILYSQLHFSLPSDHF